MNLDRISSGSWRYIFPTFVFWALFLFMGAGCGGSQPKEPAEASHLNKVGKLSDEYKQEHNGKYPETLNDLHQWAVQNGKASDADFKSTRDGEPYVLEPMGKGGVPTKGGPVLIREATGKDGKKFVFAGVRADEMGDQSLDYIRGKTAGMMKAKK
jgi:hypothetical protein